MKKLLHGNDKSYEHMKESDDKENRPSVHLCSLLFLKAILLQRWLVPGKSGGERINSHEENTERKHGQESLEVWAVPFLASL